MLFVDDVGIFAETFVHFHAIEQTQLQAQHRVDGVGRPNGTPRRGPSTQFSPPERRWRSLPPPIFAAFRGFFAC